MEKIKTTHPFSKKQLQTLNKELQKISPAQIGLNGLPTKQDFQDIKIMKSNTVKDVFLSFLDISQPDHPKFILYRINTAGVLDKHPKVNLEFNSWSEKITFFNELEEIKIE